MLFFGVRETEIVAKEIENILVEIKSNEIVVVVSTCIF